MKLLHRVPALRRHIDGAFVDREFIMRADGQVRFLTISAKFQKRVVAIIGAAIALWAAVVLFLLGSQFELSLERVALSERAQDVQSAEQRVAAYRDDVDAVAEDIEQRQDMLDTLWQSYFGDEREGDMAADAGDDDALLDKIGAAVPEAYKLATLERRQLAFVGSLERMARRRAEAASKKIRSFGLDPNQIARDDMTARGGPFIPASKEDKVSDPRFARLALSLDRMNVLETALANIPSANPAAIPDMSSRFGYRRDPITGRGAMHSGIDFRGAYGSAILAAADGTVSFAGRKGGYGNAIEIDHGNGIVTRYAHLSGIDAKVGQPVTRGAKIGRMGSTGRSTGTHLHFEVRVDGKAVDPARFLRRSNVRKQ